MTVEPEQAHLAARSAKARGPKERSRPRSLAVLIIAFRNPDQLAACLDSVRVNLPGHRVLVWDNSGRGFSGVAELADKRPDVEWHLGSGNIGFAAAVNRLAEKVPDYDLFLLNPDAILLGPLSATRAVVREDDVAAVAPLVVEFGAISNGPRGAQPWDVARRQRSVVRSLVAWAGYSELLRRTPLSELYRAAPVDVQGYLAGACLLIKRDAWDAVGPFDEEFFLYGEESDWQWRAQSVGWRLRLVNEAGVRHSWHGTVAGDALARLRSQDHLRANIALNIEHTAGARRAGIYLAGTSILDRVQRSARRQRQARRRPSSNHPAVILTTNRLAYGGAERQQIRLASELDRRGYEVIIVCLQRFGPLVADIPLSVRVVRQPWWAPMLDVDAGPRALITGDTNTETGFGTLWRQGHADRRWLVGAHVPPDNNERTYSTGLAAAMRRADGFVALSAQHWLDATAHQDLGRRSFIAPNGVASAAALNEVPVRPAPGNPPRLVMLSRIVEHKNPHVLIQALDGLRGLPWMLSIYGDGPDRERLEAMTPRDLRDRVHWHGWSPGPDQALADCDLLCVPSRLEAFPLVVLEAMARRIPVVASSVCAVPEMLDFGRAGVLVDDISATGWRNTLDALLRQTETWSAIGDRGFERLRALYTIETMADSYEQAIAAVFE